MHHFKYKSFKQKMPKTLIIIYLLLNIYFINSTTYTSTYTPYKNIKKYILRGENKTTITYTPHNSFKSYNLTYKDTYTPYKNIKKYILRGENKTTNTFTPHNSFKSYNLTDENKTLFYV